ncbi:MAG: NUDIX hydrolase [Chloroflexi bacterium]|nr:NUDIX hydrolase [Chloroflexota bacterium]
MERYRPRHILAVDALVLNAAGDVLMIDSPARGWEFPGGQVEPGETLTQALVREVFEETGVTVEVGRLVGVYQNVVTDILMLGFLCTYVSGAPTPSAESLAVEWVARGEALERIKAPFIHARMKDKLEFDGEAIYRAYRKQPGDLYETYQVVEERGI